MKWTKEKCPFCGSDGKVWEWNMRGGQTYTKCNHEYDGDTLRIESKKLVKEIAAKQNRLAEIKEMFDNAIKGE